MKISKNDHIMIIGGDARQKYLYNRILDEGFNVTAYDVPDVTQTKNKGVLKSGDIFILPVPFSRDGVTVNSQSLKLSLDELLSYVKSGSSITGGCFSDTFTEKCIRKNIRVYDLMKNESFELMNSIATAEGAIAEAITKSPVNINLSECLVIGYGKCGSSIARRLLGLGGNVTVCARNKVQQTKSLEAGHHYIDFSMLKDTIKKYDFIFNSVPCLVLTEEILENVHEDTVIIDIASKPGGTDFDACKRLSLNAHLSLSLPGKYSPKTSADIIYDCIVDV